MVICTVKVTKKELKLGRKEVNIDKKKSPIALANNVFFFIIFTGLTCCVYIFQADWLMTINQAVAGVISKTTTYR